MAQISSLPLSAEQGYGAMLTKVGNSFVSRQSASHCLRQAANDRRRTVVLASRNGWNCLAVKYQNAVTPGLIRSPAISFQHQDRLLTSTNYPHLPTSWLVAFAGMTNVEKLDHPNKSGDDRVVRLKIPVTYGQRVNLGTVRTQQKTRKQDYRFRVN